MVNCYQYLGEYVQVFFQLSSYQLSYHIIHLVQPHCFQCPVPVYQQGGRFCYYGLYYYYGPMDLQIIMILLL